MSGAHSNRLALLLTAFCLTVAPGFAQSKEFNETVPLQPGGTVSLKAYKGTVHISGWDRPEISIFARITMDADEDPAYAERVVQATRVEVRRRGNGVAIRSDYDDVPSRGGWFYQSRSLAYIHYEIHTPRQVDLRLEDYKSEIEVYELEGSLEIETYRGTLFASGLSGSVKLETYKGKAELQALRGSLDIETYKGDVVAEALQIDGSSRLDTYKGQIQLAVPANQGLTLVGEMGRRGSLTSDFEMVNPQVEEDSSRRRSRQLDSQINQGGPRLEISSHKGEIRIKRL